MKRKNKAGRKRAPQQQSILQEALAHHRAGNLQQAEFLYKKILLQKPNHPETLYSLGYLYYYAGKKDRAIELLGKSLTFKPDNLQALNIMGNALIDVGKTDEAIATFHQAITLKPELAVMHFNLGNALKNLGKQNEAIASFRQAIILKPDYTEAYLNLGTTLKDIGKTDEAIANLEQALILNPNSFAGYNNLGNAYLNKGKLEEAIASFRQAISLKPDIPQPYNNLGNALKDLEKHDEAISSYRQALALNPNYAEAYLNLGIVLKNSGNMDESIASFRQALILKPNFIEAYINLGNGLKDVGKVNEAIGNYRHALSLKPDMTEAQSNLLLSLNYAPGHSHVKYLDEAHKYGRMAADKVKVRYSKWKSSTQPERLRVGLVSGDIRSHPVGYFLENMLTNINLNQIDLIAYPTYFKEDELTDRIRSRFIAWNPLQGLDDEAAARLIHDDGMHILFDLSGHTGKNRLPVFAWKPAPVQAAWLGYFASTGLEEMDFFMADRVSVPESNKEHFTEKIWYLPETRFCFTPPVLDEELLPSPLPALNYGHITFGCFQNLAKMNGEVLAVWSRIMKLLPQARLRLQDRLLNSQALREQLQRRLAQSGIEPERVTLEVKVPRIEYLKAHAEIDIILDTFPFSGGTTTCEALWMGVPTVTLEGNTLVSRQGASLLSCTGLTDWIAKDADDYVEKTLTHAEDLEKLARLRKGLRQQVLASPLFDGPRFARNFEEAMWEMWHHFQDG